MIEIETIQELSDRLEGLINSIKEDDLEHHDFISSKYMVVALHAYTEKCQLEAPERTKEERIKFKKQHLMYKTLEELLSKKAYESTSKEMYQKLLECQKIVSDNL